MIRQSSIALILLVPTLGLGLALGCASLNQGPIENMVRAAESPADHWKIAEYYRGEATEAREKAAEHRQLAESYGGRQRWGVAFAERARGHCEYLAAREDERAASYELLAVQHERLAQE